jgi:predicted SprT family Zn-dependent metalloprotease
MENVDKFIARTVPHELAHLICDRVHPHAHQSQLVRTATGWKRTKRDVHGAYWKEVMRVLGVPHHEITRCHSYDVSNAKRVTTRTTYAYKCVTCAADFDLGPQRHAKLQRDPAALTCRRCGRTHGRLVLAANKMPAAQAVVAPRVAAPAPGAAGTKLERCQAIYRRLQASGDLTRAYAIEAFMREVGMTKAGASTYYSKCR